MYFNFRQSRIVQMPRVMATQNNPQQQQQQTQQPIITPTFAPPVMNQSNTQPPAMSQTTQPPVLAQVAIGTIEMSSENRQQNETLLLPSVKSEPTTPVAVTPVNVAPITPTSTLDEYQPQGSSDASLDQLTQFIQQSQSQNINLSQRQNPLTEFILKQQQQQQAISQLLIQQQQIAEQSRMMMSDEQIARIISQIQGVGDHLNKKKETAKLSVSDEQIARVLAIMQESNLDVSQKASTHGNTVSQEKQTSASASIVEENDFNNESLEDINTGKIRKTRSVAKLSGKLWVTSKGDEVKAEALSISHADNLDTPKATGRKRGRPKKINYDEQETQAKEIKTDFKEDVYFIYSNGERIELTENEHTEIMHSLREMRQEANPKRRPNIKTETPDR